MTEAEWQACTDPELLLDEVGDIPTDRQFRLFCVGCCRRMWPQITSADHRAAIEVAERYADGQATDDELRASHEVVGDEQPDYITAEEAATADYDYDNPEAEALYYARFAALDVVEFLSEDVAEASRSEIRSAERLAVAAVARDVFGYVFQTCSHNRVIPCRPARLAWNDAAIRKMAQAIYDERAFDRLPLLADALEDAGCADADILAHCRNSGEHVRGCWVVDLLLDKK